MAYRDPEVQRQRDRERIARRTVERVALGLCPRCGDRPPAPERSVCEPCGEKRNRAGRARDARLRAAGKPRRNPEKARASDRERDRRQRAECQAQGLCTRCGREPAAPARRLIFPGQDRGQAIARYRTDLWRRIRAGEIALEELAALDGCWLACWCHPEPCHGHVLARAAAWAAQALAERADG